MAPMLQHFTTALQRASLMSAARSRPSAPSAAEADGEKNFVSVFANAAEQRAEAERSRRAKAVALRVGALGSELDHIKSSLDGQSKGRHDSVKVKLLGGRNLPIMDFRKSDPYVKFHFSPNTKTSSVKRGNLNPTWTESFVFKIADLSAELPILKVEVFDEDLHPGTTSDDDDLLGRVDVELEGSLTIHTPIRKWFTLGDLGNNPSGPEGSEAQIELDISFYGVEERRKEKEGRLRGRFKSGSEDITKGDEVKLSDDSKRMVLLGHLGRMRNPAPDVRRIAIQSIAKVAGPRGVDLPKMSDWAEKLVRSLLERIESDPNPDVRLDALEALGHTAQPGVPEAIRAVSVAAKDSSKEVRLVAVKLFHPLSKSGDDTAIATVGCCLEDPDQSVRDAASRTLPKLSSEFDERLVHEALQRLSNMHAVVRKTAVQTLVMVTTTGAPVVVEGLIKAINDFDVNVKTLAISELAKQAGRIHPEATQAVGEQLKDSCPQVREAAASALAAMATKADRQVISRLVGVLDDSTTDIYGHLSIQAAALASIREVSAADRAEDFSPRTRGHISQAIQRQLKSPDWCLRKEAINTLVRTAQPANRREVLECLVTMLEDHKIEVRREAMQNLESYRDGLDKWIISCIACLLVSPTGVVRDSASNILSKLLENKLDAANCDLLKRVRQGKLPTNGEVIAFLSQIVSRGDEEYLDGFLVCMRHTTTSIRSLASDAIQSICIPGQSCVVEEIIKNLQHESANVKRDSILTLSKIVLKNDDRVSQIVQDMLKNPSLEVKRAVPIALENMLAQGDSRRTVALACVQLDSGYHTDNERKDALEQLGQLAFASSKFQIEGWSVEDADMERFWQQIRLPRGPTNGGDTHKFVPKILKSLHDETPWVRRAGVDAIMHCARRGDPQVVDAVCALLEDSSFAIRMAAVGALAVLANPGDKQVVTLILERMNDSSHLVRSKSIETLKRVARIGDSATVRSLMSFLRNSWEYVKVRGEDTDIKLQVAHLLFHSLAFKDHDKIQFLLEAIQHPEPHVERDRIEYFEDFLISQNLMTRYLGYAQRLRRELSDERIKEAAESSGFTMQQLLMIIHLQRRVIKKRKVSRQVVTKVGAFQDEKDSGRPRVSRPRPRAMTFQEQVLAHRIQGKLGGVSRSAHSPDPASLSEKSVGKARKNTDAGWFRKADEHDAEMIIRRFVPSTVRYSALALAHQRMQAGVEGAKLWEKLRWTKRLRLCEEINGASF